MRPISVLRHEAPHAHAGHAPVSHAEVGLGFCLAGRATLELRERWTLEAGDVLLVPAGMPHRLLSADAASTLGVSLCASCLAAEGLGDLLDPFRRVRAGAAAVVRLPEARRAWVRDLLDELERETREGASPRPRVALALLTLVLAEVRAAAGWTAPGEGVGVHGDLVADALRYIEERCLEPIGLADVARAVRRSPGHVTTKVREATGRSVGEWILEGRIAEAERRLVHTDEQVAIVAERVGYQDPTHFIRVFRRARGVTPAAWRALARTGAAPPPAAGSRRG